MVRPDAFLRAAANFSGSRPVSMLGARRRRPSKKLEIEMREIEMREIEMREIGAGGRGAAGGRQSSAGGRQASFTRESAV